MSKTYSNIPNSSRCGYDMWGNRPLAGKHLNKHNKRKCRRVERRQGKNRYKSNSWQKQTNHTKSYMVRLRGFSVIIKN